MQASRLQVHGNCSKTKSLQDETKLKAGFNASLELQCHETIEIRTKHFRASFEIVEIEAKQYDKEGALFWFSKREKKQARKNGPSQFKLPLAAVAGQISFILA